MTYPEGRSRAQRLDGNKRPVASDAEVQLECQLCGVPFERRNAETWCASCVRVIVDADDVNVPL